MEVSFQRVKFMAPYILNYRISLFPEDAVTNFETTIMTIDINDRHAGAVMIECFYWIHPLLKSAF